MLKKIAAKMNINGMQLNAMIDQIERNMDKFDGSMIYPIVADKLSDILSDIIINNSESVNSVFTQEEIEKLSGYRCDYFKYVVAREFQEYHVVEEMKEEIEQLKKAMLKIGTVITTNYDEFLEKEILPSNFSIKYRQNQLYFVDKYEYECLYKIHGTATRPESIIINSDDYKKISDNSRLFIVKLYNILMTSPVIFLGYGMNDSDILNILYDFSVCFDFQTLEQITKNIIFIDYKKNETNIIETQESIQIKGRNLPITVVKTDNYLDIYKMIASMELSVSPFEANKYRKIISKLVYDNEKGLNTIKVVGDERLSEMDPQKLIIAIGKNDVINKIQELGVVGFSYNQIVLMALKNESEYVDKIVEIWYEQQGITNNYNMPAFFLKSKYNKEIKTNSRYSNNLTYLTKKFENKKINFLKVEDNISRSNALAYSSNIELTTIEQKNLYCAYTNNIINKEDFRSILLSIFANNKEIIKQTYFKELVCFMDFLE